MKTASVVSDRAPLIAEIRYRLLFDGVSPMIMNSNAALLEGEDKGRDPAKWEREHFLEKCYRDEAGSLVIPARAVKKSFVEACRFVVRKPKGVSFRSYGPLIEAAMVIPTDALLDVPIERVQPLTLVVNLDPSKGNKGPRGPRTRPMIPLPWTATAELIVFDQILTEDVLQEIAERAGKQVGLLDGRRIDFGRALISLTRVP